VESVYPRPRPQIAAARYLALFPRLLVSFHRRLYVPPALSKPYELSSSYPLPRLPVKRDSKLWEVHPVTGG
jgi:hypothetical protein